MIMINGELWMPYYRWVYNGYYSGGFYVMDGWKKIEKQEDVKERFIKG